MNQNGNDRAAPPDLLRIATAGSVDDGKSTLIGRLLYDSKAIAEDQMAALTRASRLRADGVMDLALLTDGLRAEREQGITIDVAYRYFATPRRAFIIADTPGHLEYTRNMVTGASTADLAIVLIDARKGVVTQSRRHGFIAALLEIPHLVVAVNKMDLVQYREAAFRAIEAEYAAFARQLAVASLAFVPIAALHGDNVVQRSAQMPWYEGPSLVECLERVPADAGAGDLPLRMPVQLTLRPHAGFRGVAGQIAAGALAVGDEVLVLPARRHSQIHSLAAGGEVVQRAVAGDSVVVTLRDELDVGRGDMIVRAATPPRVADHLDAALCWLDEEPLDPARTYLLQHTTRQVRARVAAVANRVDVDTLRALPARTLALNEVGHVQIETAQPLCFDAYRANRATGSFILIDPVTHNTVAAGLIQEGAPAAPVAQPARPAQNVVWSQSSITRAARAARNGHQAAVLWFTGLSGAGKSTIAHALERRLFALGCQTLLLDGDNLRHSLNRDLGFSAADRAENIRRAAAVAEIGAAHGQIVLCTLISPLRADRDAARALIPAGHFLEIHVAASLEACARRDPKGLYAKAQRGEIAEFTGISAPYEPPNAPEVTLQTETQSVEECVAQLIEELSRRALLEGAAA